MEDTKYKKTEVNYKFEIIRDQLIDRIENGSWSINSHFPSIAAVSESQKVSKVTVSRAYQHLKKRGYIYFKPGKGFFVGTRYGKTIKVLLIYNKLSHYKKLIYDGIVESLAGYAKIDLQIHYYNLKTLDEIICENIGKYDYYVIMPHFEYGTSSEDIVTVLRKIPNERLLLLDKFNPLVGSNVKSVYQDFSEDIYTALNSLTDLFTKYTRVKIVLPVTSNHPIEIIDGVEKFCREQNKTIAVLESSENEVLVAKTAYIVVEESNLSDLIKKVNTTKYIIGKDIGILSFNETVLKDLLKITVCTTDFINMGRQSGILIKEGRNQQIKNPFKVIRRGSL